MKYSRRRWLDRNGWNNLRARAPKLALIAERLTRKKTATDDAGRPQPRALSGISEREFQKAARTLRLGGLPPEPVVAELIERWEREDFEDCLPPWHRMNLWRRRAHWERDYVFRF